MFRLDRETNKKLEQMQSSYRIVHSTADGSITAEIICKVTGKTYAKAIGENEADAVRNGVKAAAGATRPRTPAQALVDADRLEKENAELRRKLAQANASPSPAPAPETPPKPVDPDSDEADLESMTAAELIAMIKSAGKTVPEGDRRTQEWRQSAIALIIE